MITSLDHMVLLTRDLDAAVRTYATLLGRAPAWRSSVEGMAIVHFTFANVSLELLTPAGSGAGADRVRAALEASGEGLASLGFQVDDIDRAHQKLERVGLKPEPITEAAGADATTGRALRWRRTRAATDASHGIRLFFLQLNSERPQSKPDTDAPVLGLDHVVIATANPDRAIALYGGKLGLEMVRDLTRPDWNSRLMFFRCGDLLLEVVQRLDRPVSDQADRLWGLSWRVADADAARARLAASGVEVDDVRPGRLPGTRVFTAKSGTLGVPTLMIEPRKPGS